MDRRPAAQTLAGRNPGCRACAPARLCGLRDDGGAFRSYAGPNRRGPSFEAAISVGSMFEGQIRFIGRHDRQYKLAGVRIVLDGVEHVISELAEVAGRGSFVVGPEDARQVCRPVVNPVAIVDDRGSLLRKAIFDHCRAWLPRAAIPARVMFVDEIPTGGSGKKAHAALRAILERSRHVSTGLGGLPETNSIEARLASFWREQLAANHQLAEAIHLEDDVFALGATSLDAVAVLEQIERTYSICLPDGQIFLRRSIARQAGGYPSGARERFKLKARRMSRLVVAFRPRARSAGFRGVRAAVFAPPGYHSDAFFAVKLAANSSRGIRLFAPSTADFGGKRLTKPTLPLRWSTPSTRSNHSWEIAPPRAFVGFSISRLVGVAGRGANFVADGFESIPIVNFDGGPAHLYYPYPTHILLWRREPRRFLNKRETAHARKCSCCTVQRGVGTRININIFRSPTTGLLARRRYI